MKAIIHTKKNCPYCVKAKVFFDTHQIKYEEVHHNQTKARNAFYKELSDDLGKDIKSMPQIFVDDEYIGGYTQLVSKSAKILKDKMSMLESSLTYKPFRYPWAVELAKIHEQIHWIEEEIDLSDDMSDWKMVGVLSKQEKDFIINVLRLFTQSDVAVATNYCEQFIPKIKANELRNMLMSFAARETIHQRAYALLNDTLGLPDSEYHAFLEYSEMADKIEYASSGNPNTHRGLALCMVRSVFVEGLMLFASFAALMNFQRYGKMKGMCKVVEWSLRDEALLVGTLVVVKDGVKPIEDITLEDLVLQFDINTGIFSYTNPTKHCHVIRDELYHYHGDGFDQKVSPNHRMIYEQNGEIKECLAKDFIPSEDKYFIGKELNFKKIKSTDVVIDHIKTSTPKDFYCIGVNGKAFVVQDEYGNQTVTGNTTHVEGISTTFTTFCKEKPHFVDDSFKKEIYDIARETVKLEDKFIDLLFKNTTIEGLDKKDMKQYIRYIADRRLLQLGMKPHFKVKKNPLDWMEWLITGTDHSNFFENRVTEYSVSGLSGKFTYKSWT